MMGDNRSSGVGIAGAMDYKPTKPDKAEPRCYVCGQPFESSVAARAAPGGLALACSKSCAADPKFQNPWIEAGPKPWKVLSWLRGLMR